MHICTVTCSWALLPFCQLNYQYTRQPQELVKTKPHKFIARFDSVDQVIQKNGIFGSRKTSSRNFAGRLLHGDSLIVFVQRLQQHKPHNCKHFKIHGTKTTWTDFRAFLTPPIHGTKITWPDFRAFLPHQYTEQRLYDLISELSLPHQLLLPEFVHQAPFISFHHSLFSFFSFF